MSLVDQQIKKDVIDLLYNDISINASNVKVEVNDGIVDLQGNVPSYGEITSAANKIYEIKGVKKVINKLNVDYPEGYKLPQDKDIKNRIENVFEWHSYLNEENITVEVEKGEVTLTGSVTDYWKKESAEVMAGSILGVINVDNKLGIVPTEDVIDNTIAKIIYEKLEKNYLVDKEDIEVKVKDGKVTLSGEVPNSKAYFAANNAAIFTSGVIYLNNNLRIES